MIIKWKHFKISLITCLRIALLYASVTTKALSSRSCAPTWILNTRTCIPKSGRISSRL